VLERQGEFDDASQAFTEALAIDAKRWQAHLGRGLCRLHLGQFSEALEDFQVVLKEQPNHDRGLFGKAVALQQLGQLDEAAEIYRKLLPSNASSAELLVNLIASFDRA
jgi:Tfp pilus assembly protein PilF